jgi:hypothetical protein
MRTGRGIINPSIEKSGGLSDQVEQIAREVSRCTRFCSGIVWYTTSERPTLCVHLEEEGRADGLGTIVVDLHPGPANEWTVSPDAREDVQALYWAEAVVDDPYYTPLRKFVGDVGLHGPILWTKLVKCETPIGAKGSPPLDTLRRCTSLYLQRELTLVPPSWPIIAVGRAAHRAVTYLPADRPIIGIPHPLVPKARRAMQNNLLLDTDVIDRVKIALRDGTAPWIALRADREEIK